MPRMADPADISELTVEYEGHAPWFAIHEADAAGSIVSVSTVNQSEKGWSLNTVPYRRYLKVDDIRSIEGYQKLDLGALPTVTV